MSLKLPILLVLLVLLPVVSWLTSRKPRKRAEAKFLAESQTLARLPSYKKIIKKQKIFRLVEILVLSLMFIFLTLIAARPTKTIQKIDEENSRDIVLCMDASGSMKDSIPGALKTMKSVVEDNPYDRYGITIFQTQAYSAIPLTRDIAAVNQTIDELIKGFTATTTSLDGKEIDAFNSYDYMGYASGGTGGTDIGAGLAGCINRFGDLELKRSRHIIFITDLEHNGVIDPLQIGQLIPRYDINLYVISPEQFFEGQFASRDNFLDVTGASVAEFGDNAAIEDILQDIYNTILNKNEVRSLVVVDNPYPYWFAVLLLSWAWIGLLYYKRGRL